MNKPRYQDYIDDLAQGHLYGIFIDDSGSPGLKNTPLNLHPDRKTWVAVIVEPSLMPAILKEFPGALKKLYEKCGATEFHFADIYAGRKAFHGISLDVRLGIFRFMSTIFKMYRFPIIVQTLDPDTLLDIRTRYEGELPKELHYFDLAKQSDMALLYLLHRIEHYMKHTTIYSKAKARVFADEGFKRNGLGMKLPHLSEVFVDGLICFADSTSILPIQLADFAAFTLNRQQLILGQERLSTLDISFLEITSPIAFNYINIPKALICFQKAPPPDK